MKCRISHLQLFILDIIAGKFEEGFFHPNVYASGAIMLPLLQEYQGWQRNFSIQDILLAIQDMLDEPGNGHHPHEEATRLRKKDEERYQEIIKEQKCNYMD